VPSKYKFHNPEGLYFVTLTVVDWIDVFSRQIHRDILVDSLIYSIVHKGLIIHAWVIMSNHVHLIISAQSNYNISDIMRDMKKFTAKKIISEIRSIKESRKVWMVDIFKKHVSKNSNNKTYQFWQQDNHPITLDNNHMIDQILNYLHNNPVAAGIVEFAEQYIYSSASDYCDEKGLIPLELIY
jgi:REP-associated tyrosine transposase